MVLNFMKSNNNHSISDICTTIAKRWLRLFLPYLAIRLFYAYVFPTFNNGVLWHEVRSEAAFCKTHLLDALLTLPSARSAGKLCLHPTWQIPVDFQLFCIGYVCLTLCRRYKLSEIRAFLSLLALGMAVTIYNIISNEYTSIFYMDLKRPIVDRSNDNEMLFNSVYLSSPARLGSYIMGALTTLAAQKMKDQRCTLTKMQQFGGLGINLLIKYVLTLLASTLYEQTMRNKYSLGLHVLYGSVKHSLANPPLYFLSFIYLMDLSSPLQIFGWFEKRTPRVAVSLSRLSYSVSLSHFIVIMPYTYSQRSLFPYTNLYSLVHTTTADVVLSYALAFFFYLFIEGPTQNLISIWNTNNRKAKAEQSDENVASEISKKKN